ncbi:MAG: fumarylacetoacetate hydrolase family protein [Verrucomicrobiota bacterium]
MAFRIYHAPDQVLIESAGELRAATKPFSFDDLFQSDDPLAQVNSAYEAGSPAHELPDRLAAPMGHQEVWAAGVTYFRSRTARMEEAETAGGDIFYDKVYEAERPELFFKATAPRTRGHGDLVAIRSDSSWDVPEPELTLAINRSGQIFGYTIGNDMSSRSIEGENPLYLPQAKVYTGSCAMGPCLLVGPPPSSSTSISIAIERDGETGFSGETDLSQLKRGLEELAEFLFRSNEFAFGAFLMTGTGIVPDSDFTLLAGDVISITIEGIGTLTNAVEVV